MNTETKAVQPASQNRQAVAAPPKTPISVGKRGLSLRSLEEMYRFSVAMKKAGIGIPSDTPETILAKLQTGLELGLTPMQSVKSLYVVKGRVGMETAPMKALVLRSGLAEYIESGTEGEGEALVGWCEAKRKGAKNPVRRTFSLKQAKQRGLVRKDSAWENWPERMCVWRAMSFVMKEEFPDVLMGLDDYWALRDAPDEPEAAEFRVKEDVSLDSAKAEVFGLGSEQEAETEETETEPHASEDGGNGTESPSRGELLAEIGRLHYELQNLKIDPNKADFSPSAEATVDELIAVRNRIVDTLASYDA